VLFRFVLENTAALDVKLADADMQELEREFQRLGVSGTNAPPEYLSVHDIGSYIGSSSKGTHGNWSLPAKRTGVGSAVFGARHHPSKR
jgi:hypothetical protein